MTPREFGFVFDSYNEKNIEQAQLSWEQTRFILYYQYISFPKKGRNPSYNTFKAKHLPFPWDRVNKEETEEVVTLESLQDAGLSPKDWASKIKNLQSTNKVVSNEELTKTQAKLK